MSQTQYWLWQSANMRIFSNTEEERMQTGRTAIDLFTCNSARLHSIPFGHFNHFWKINPFLKFDLHYVGQYLFANRFDAHTRRMPNNTRHFPFKFNSTELTRPIFFCVCVVRSFAVKQKHTDFRLMCASMTRNEINLLLSRRHLTHSPWSIWSRKTMPHPLTNCSECMRCAWHTRFAVIRNLSHTSSSPTTTTRPIGNSNFFETHTSYAIHFYVTTIYKVKLWRCPRRCRK